MKKRYDWQKIYDRNFMTLNLEISWRSRNFCWHSMSVTKFFLTVTIFSETQSDTWELLSPLKYDWHVAALKCASDKLSNFGDIGMLKQLNDMYFFVFSNSLIHTMEILFMITGAIAITMMIINYVNLKKEKKLEI